VELFIQVAIQGVLLGATLGLIALGASIVYSVSGLVNFAHGDFMIVAMFLALLLYRTFSMDPYLSLFIVAPFMYLVGLLVYRFLIKPVAQKHILLVAQLTLGMVFAIQGLLLFSFGGETQRVPSVLSTSNWRFGEISIRVPMVVAFAVAVILAGGFYIILMRTDYGRSVRAVHQNPHAAARMGVKIAATQYHTFAVGIAAVAVAGIALLPTTPFLPSSGLHFTLTTFIIMILGGMGNFVGTVIAGIAIGIATAFGEVYVSGAIGQMLPFLLFVAVVLWRPQGLLRTA
jgi:branched-chain amino acid transport system permease protein